MTRRDLLAGAGTLPLSLFRGKDGPFDTLMEQARRGGWAGLPMGERAGRVGMALVGTPYVGWTLEREDGIERCTVKLDGLDCVTLFETSLGFARMLGRGGKSPEGLVAAVRATRYRRGVEDGYLSRLHYTSDWFATNERRGIVQVLRLPGAVRFDRPVHFMSEHKTVYKMLRPEDHEGLREMEARVSALQLPYVPEAALKGIEGRLRTGDIVGLVTSRPGMDIDHTGMIVRDAAGQARFLNASSVQKKVVLDGPISECLGPDRLIGAMFARPR